MHSEYLLFQGGRISATSAKVSVGAPVSIEALDWLSRHGQSQVMASKSPVEKLSAGAKVK